MRFEGETFTEGDLESLVEHGRKNLALALKNGRLEPTGTSPQAANPELTVQ